MTRFWLLLVSTPVLAFLPSQNSLTQPYQPRPLERRCVVASANEDSSRTSSQVDLGKTSAEIAATRGPRRFFSGFKPLALVRRFLNSAPVAAVVLSVAMLQSAAPVHAAKPKYDFTYDELREERNQKTMANSKYIYVALTPLAVRSIIKGSKRRKKNEKVRVTKAIETLELLRDEFMDVEGQAESDQDIFNSLSTRSEELGEEASKKAEEERKADEKARGVEDLFGLDDDDEQPKAKRGDSGPANRRRKSSIKIPPPAGSASKPVRKTSIKKDDDDDDLFGGDDSDDDEDDDDDSDTPTMASDEDVERLKRMFGA